MRASEVALKSDPILQPSVRAGLKLEWEKFEDIIPEFFPLIVEEWKNTFTQIVDEPPDPDWDDYIARNRSGSYFILCARFDGKLIGYTGYNVYNHGHFKFKVANQDSYYVQPEHRNKGIGPMFRKEAERGAKLLGCKKIMSYYPVGGDQEVAYDKYMKRYGYRPAEKNYVKDL